MDSIGEREADENQKLLNEAARINGNAAHADHREDGDPGVKIRGSNAFDGSRGQIEADDRDDGAGDYRRHKPFNPFDAGAHDDEADSTVNEAADDDAAERHGYVGIRSRTSSVSRCRNDHADEGKGRTQVARHVAAYEDEKNERAEAAHQNGEIGVEPHKERRQNSGAEHGDDVLYAECERLACRQTLIWSNGSGSLQLPAGEVTHLDRTSENRQTAPF